MTVSLMSLLGGNVNLSAGVNSDELGEEALANNGDAAFETIMSASELQDVSAEDLRQYFVAHGAELPDSLKNTQNKSAGDVLVQLLAANGGKNLPGDMKLALQEVLPQNVVDSVEQAFELSSGVDADALAEVIASLPDRELTAKELSDLVQETGFSPVVIFTALQDTPAASPNLAYAMVEDMGGAELDANLPLPKHAADELASYVPSQTDAAVGQLQAEPMDETQFAVLQRIAAALNGEKAQSEFNWGAAEVAAAPNVSAEAAPQANSNVVPLMQVTATSAPKEAELQGAASRQQAAPVEAVATVATQAASSQEKPMKPQERKLAAPVSVAAQEVQPDAEAETVAPLTQVKTQGDAGKQQAKPQGEPLLADGKPAPQSATQATDAPQQSTSFAASLEQSSSLRGAGTADNINSHLRHVPQQQAGVPMDQVTVHIGKAIANGNTQMEIHLKPAELGRVEVKVETDADGMSHVTVTADRKETLEMLQRDVRGLERTLADAGLKTDSNGLSFNLRGGEGQQQQAQNGQDGQNGKPKFDLNGNYADIDERLGESEMALTYDAGRAYRLNVDWGVDISV